MLASLALSALALIPSALALPTISAVGSKFFTSDGDQWFIKGIAYQRSEADPLLDTTQCTVDAKLMQTLGTNAIRVYHVDADGNHDGCMKAFSDVGIYLFVDLDTFNTYILGTNPYWNQTQFDHYSAVLDTFQKYDNTAGFLVGNEVIFTSQESEAAASVKAASRDLKAYRDSKGYRKIPIGYSAADIAELRPMLQNYLVCGGNASEAVDFFSLNSYEWCGNVNYNTSGYSKLQEGSEGYPVPIFFSETGCIIPAPRDFADQAAIFGPNMVNTWSGAIIYEWIQEQNKYGIISYGGTPDAPVRSGTPTPLAPEFEALKAAWKIQPSGVKLSDYSASASKLSTPACPSATAGGWAINGNPVIPPVGGARFNPTGSSLPSATGGNSASNPSSTSSTAGATPTNGSGSGNKQLVGMTSGLAIVMLGFVFWL